MSTRLPGIRELWAAVEGQGGGSGGFAISRPDSGEESISRLCGRPGDGLAGDSASFISTSSLSPDTLGVVAVNGGAPCVLGEGDVNCVMELEWDGDTGTRLICSKRTRSA